MTVDERADRPPFPPEDLLEMAWSLICSADTRTIDERNDDWGECARRWRAGYFAAQRSVTSWEAS